MAALARALIGRGHECVFLAQPDARSRVPADGIAFHAIGATSHPPGDLARTERHMGRITGPLGVARTIRDVARRTDMLAREGAPAVRALGIDAIVSDQMEPAGGLIAEHLDLPYVSVANALLINREPSVPPPYLGWRYDASDWGRRRNEGGYRVSDWLMRPVGDAIEVWCGRWHLPPRRRIEDCLSPFAQITQTVPGFDYPRRERPGTLHSCGPLRDDDHAVFAWPDTRGRPLVFASLGTLQGARLGIFERIAEACRRLDLALILTHGGRLSASEAAALPGAPSVHAFVPQRLILPRAALAVSNGGLNTVLDALSFGVPVVAIPLAFEQGAIAARLVRGGSGAAINPFTLSAGRLAALMRSVLTTPSYARRATEMAAEIGEAGGVARAADIVERVLRSGRPVTRADLTVAEMQA